MKDFKVDWAWICDRVEVAAATLFVLILMVVLAVVSGVFLTYAVMVLGFPTDNFLETSIGASRFLLVTQLSAWVMYLTFKYLKSFSEK